MIYTEYKCKQRILKNIIQACQHLLIGSEHANKVRLYLNSRLGKTDQLFWEFGYFPSDNHINDLIELIPKQDLEKVKLYYPKFLANGFVPHGHFANHNLILPFKDIYGDITSLVGRCILSEEKRKEELLNKYKYSIQCRKDFYIWGLDKAKNSIIQNNYVIGVEGQFDCIALHKYGIHNVVAFGCANLSKYQMYHLLKYTNNIVLMFDNDEAGQKAKKRIKKKYGGVVNIKLISPPNGFKDIDEFFFKTKDTKYVQSVIDVLRGFNE